MASTTPNRLKGARILKRQVEVTAQAGLAWADRSRTRKPSRDLVNQGVRLRFAERRRHDRNDCRPPPTGANHVLILVSVQDEPIDPRPCRYAAQSLVA